MCTEPLPFVCPDRKAVLDADKRELRLYQERYLIDGDLHSDGPGRMRRFRWKNIGAFLIRRWELGWKLREKMYGFFSFSR